MLTYHAVGPIPSGPTRHGFVPVDVFERQMEFLARHRRVVALEEKDPELWLVCTYWREEKLRTRKCGIVWPYEI